MKRNYLLVIFFIFITSLSCNWGNEDLTFIGPPTTTPIYIKYMKLDGKSFKDFHTNSDYFIFSYPVVNMPSVHYEVNFYKLNSSDASQYSLAPTSTTIYNIPYGGKPFYVTASKLSYDEAEDFISDVKSEADFANFGNTAGEYYVSFETKDVSSVGGHKYLRLALVVYTADGSKKSNANLKTNPCPPCNN